MKKLTEYNYLELEEFKRELCDGINRSGNGQTTLAQYRCELYVDANGKDCLFIQSIEDSNDFYRFELS